MSSKIQKWHLTVEFRSLAFRIGEEDINLRLYKYNFVKNGLKMEKIFLKTPFFCLIILHQYKNALKQSILKIKYYFFFLSYFFSIRKLFCFMSAEIRVRISYMRTRNSTICGQFTRTKNKNAFKSQKNATCKIWAF